MKPLHFLTLIAVIFLQSCDLNPALVNEEELITTVVLKLDPKNGDPIVTLKFTDLDGDGSNQPVIQTGELKKGQIYSSEIQFLNESKSPTEDITTEVKEEGDLHQIFYSTAEEILSVTYKDIDKNNNPVGLSTSMIAGPNLGTYAMRVSLVHMPNKTGLNVSSGDITNAGGETDIEALLSFTIK